MRGKILVLTISLIMTFFYGSPFPKLTDWGGMSVDYEAEAKGNRVCRQLFFKSYGARQLQTGWVEATGGVVGVR